MSTGKEHFLVDMDGVVADWSKLWDSMLDEHYPHLPIVRSHEQQSFDLHAGLDEESSAAVRWVMDHPDFYDALEPIEGAVEALQAMVARGHQVHLVTSPWVTNPHCASAKLRWAEKHIGPGWADRVIITKDKTLVRGDVLIDDKPMVTGALAPTWVHILFDAPYNRERYGVPFDTTSRGRMKGWGTFIGRMSGREMAAKRYAVLRGETLRPADDGKWLDISHIPESMPDWPDYLQEMATTHRAEATGRFEYREDGARAEVYEVKKIREKE